jgi:hypothetical protein
LPVPLHLGVARDQTTQCVGRLHRLKAPVLGLKLGKAERALENQVQPLRFEGLGEKVVGPERHRAQRVAVVVLAGQHDDLQVRVDVEHLAEQREALGRRVRVGRQAEVHRHHAGLVALELRQRRLAVVGRDRDKAVEGPLDLLLQRQVVFDDQKLRTAGRVHLAL